MIAARLLSMLLAGWLVLGAIGGTLQGWQPSALRLTVCGVFGLLAPLFWPGRGPTGFDTLKRVVGWSVAVAGLALATLQLVDPSQPLARHLPVCAMLLPILLLTHGAAVILEAAWLDGAGAACEGVARERAGRCVCLLLGLLGALPLWLGPAAERLSAQHGWAIDLVADMSPLTHLALAAGNDLLRNPWFYEHANLANLQVNEPGIGALLGWYAASGFAMWLVAVSLRRWRSTPVDATPIALEKESFP